MGNGLSPASGRLPARSPATRLRALVMLLCLASAGCQEILGLETGIVQGQCEATNQCAPDFTCWRGECRNACTSNDDCGEGFRCVRSFQDSACEPNDATCGEGDAICEPGTTCDDSLTMPACFTLCSRDAECLPGESCDAKGLCRSDDPAHTPMGKRDAGIPDASVEAEPAPMRGRPCDGEGDLACMGDGQQSRLVCNEGQWKPNGMCEPGQLCDRTDGKCKAVEPLCEGRVPRERLCIGNTLVLCGPDLVSAERVACGGVCVTSAGGASCALASCGDGTVQAGEACDDGNLDSDDACTALCRKARCGDGLVYEAEEACDDGNDIDSDACPSSCQEARCGDGFVHAGVEDCDDGNDDDSDGCDRTCHRPGCGDGRVSAGEICDDGNQRSGDGCSASCRPEPVDLEVGDHHTCVRFADGRVKCWGNNSGGQLGLGDEAHRGDQGGEMGGSLPFVDLGAGRRVVTLGAGDLHNCAILDTGSTKCWGVNSWGQLGLGSTRTYGDNPGEMGDSLPALNLGTGRTARDVVPATGWTCALLDDGQVKCFGWNDEGEAGVEDTVTRGNGPGEMGDALPAAMLGEGLTGESLTARWARTCAVLSNRRVKCWGFSLEGDLGLGDIRTRGDDRGEMGDNLPFVDLGTDFEAVALAAGRAHTCALSKAGTVKCWGASYDGQLGIGTRLTRGDNSGEMGDRLPVVDLGGERVLQVAAGHEHTCALLESGDVKCWGWNAYGHLGLGDERSRGGSASHMGNNLPAVSLGSGRKAKSIGAGAHHTCALLDDGSLKCWGDNPYGQLGLGDTERRGDEPGEMGDALPAVVLW